MAARWHTRNDTGSDPNLSKYLSSLTSATNMIVSLDMILWTANFQHNEQVSWHFFLPSYFFYKLMIQDKWNTAFLFVTYLFQYQGSSSWILWINMSHSSKTSIFADIILETPGSSLILQEACQTKNMSTFKKILKGYDYMQHLQWSVTFRVLQSNFASSPSEKSHGKISGLRVRKFYLFLEWITLSFVSL